MIKAVIFDCFGVIITDALEIIKQELAVTDPEKAQSIKDIIIASNRGMIESEKAKQQVANLLGITVNEYRQRIADGEVKDQRLLDYIAQLRNTYKTGMLSNIGSGGLQVRFGEEELTKYFDVVVASSDIGFAKPEAQAYEYAADKLEVRLDECVFLDDREIFCEAARSVGMKAIVYQSFEQAKAELEKTLDDSKS